MRKKYKHLDLQQRIQIKEMLEEGCSIAKIAETLGYNQTTIYRELERNTTNGKYDPYQAQNRYNKKLQEKGPAEKLSNPELAKYISDLILVKHLSLEKIVLLLAEDNHGFSDVPQSTTTIYSAIDKGIIPGVTRETLQTRYSTVFNNGQVCIPKWVLDKLDIKDGDVLLLEITEKNEILYKKRN